jgi:hypothetical protein
MGVSSLLIVPEKDEPVSGVAFIITAPGQLGR